jgi:Zn-dependent M28 family amino/carboxypeptidase
LPRRYRQCLGNSHSSRNRTRLYQPAKATAEIEPFAFVTGEEMGLLGSDYFAHFPTVPLKSIVANINIDGAPGPYYLMKDVVALGAEHSSLGIEVAAAGKEMGYDITPDPMPEAVAFIRGDQYSFMLQGVPAVYIVDGIHATDPKVNALQVNKDWLATHYHTPLDNMKQPFVFESITQAAVMNFLVGYQIAQRDQAPTWNERDFFGMTFGPRHAGTGE